MTEQPSQTTPQINPNNNSSSTPQSNINTTQTSTNNLAQNTNQPQQPLKKPRFYAPQHMNGTNINTYPTATAAAQYLHNNYILQQNPYFQQAACFIQNPNYMTRRPLFSTNINPVHKTHPRFSIPESQKTIREALIAWSKQDYSLAEKNFVDAICCINKKANASKTSDKTQYMLDIASILHNRGLIARKQNRNLDALKHFERAFKIFRDLEAKDPEVVLVINSLAQFYISQDRLTDALRFLLRAEVVYKSQYGEESIAIANTYNDISLLYTKKKLWLKAAEFCHKSINIRLRFTRPDDGEILRLKNSLALLYRKANHKDMAETLLLDILKAIEEKYGVNHPIVLKHLINLASIYEIDLKFARAEHLLARCMDAYAENAGSDSSEVAFVMYHFGSVFIAQGKFEKALCMLRSCLDIRIKVYGEIHRLVADVYLKIAVLHWANGRWTQAEKNLSKAVQILSDLQQKEKDQNEGDRVNVLERQVLKYAKQMFEKVKRRDSVCIMRI